MALLGITFQLVYHERYKLLETCCYVVVGVFPAVAILDMVRADTDPDVILSFLCRPIIKVCSNWPSVVSSSYRAWFSSNAMESFRLPTQSGIVSYFSVLPFITMRCTPICSFHRYPTRGVAL